MPSSRSQNVHLLFAYGTLREPAVQEALFGRCLNCEAATINGWRRCICTDGYPFIHPDEDSKVEGVVLMLSDEELTIADSWEEVPVYERESLSCKTVSGEIPVWAYTCRHTEGEPCPEGLGDICLEDVVKQARMTRSATLKR